MPEIRVVLPKQYNTIPAYAMKVGDMGRIWTSDDTSGEVVMRIADDKIVSLYNPNHVWSKLKSFMGEGPLRVTLLPPGTVVELLIPLEFPVTPGGLRIRCSIWELPGNDRSYSVEEINDKTKFEIGPYLGIEP